MFWQSLYNTAYIVLLSVPLGIIVALVLALLLNMRVTGQSVYRVIFYLPAMVPVVAGAVVWAYVFNPKYGVMNSMLAKVGIEGPGWLSDPAWAKPALIIMGVWAVGNLMVILLAGLQDVPQDLYDQAKVDGASTGSRFRHVTIPFLSPHLLFALVTGLIAGFAVLHAGLRLVRRNGWSGRIHVGLQSVPVPVGVHVLQAGLCERDRLGALPHHSPGGTDHVPVRRPARLLRRRLMLRGDTTSTGPAVTEGLELEEAR